MRKQKKKDYIDYYEISSEFDQVYLEDSYVEYIEDNVDKVIFFVDFVLRENHPLYQKPKPNEKYFYLRGKINFNNVLEKVWYSKCFTPSYDALGLVDIGHIDTFIFCKEETYIDWLRTDIEETQSLPQGLTYLSGERRIIPKEFYYLSGGWGAVAIKSDKPFIEV